MSHHDFRALNQVFITQIESGGVVMLPNRLVENPLPSQPKQAPLTLSTALVISDLEWVQSTAI